MIRSSVLLFAASALVFPAAAWAGDAAVPKASTIIAVPGVSVAVAARKTLTDKLVVPGNLGARDEVLVAPEVDGLRVVALLADEGDRVSAGQVLARLSRETLEAQLAQNSAAIARADAAIAQANDQIPQAEAALTESRAALARTVALRENGNATQELLDQRTATNRTAEARVSATRNGLVMSQADKASAEAQRRELDLKLQRTEIKSPVAGIVSRRSVRLGAMSSAAGDPMFRIVGDGKVELEAEVLETHLSGLKTGAEVTVTPVGGKPVTGSVRLLPAEIDRTTRLGLVRVALPDDPSLRVGAFARAEIVVAQRDGVAVPTSAVLFGADGAKLQVVKDGRVETRRVTTGISAQGSTEVLSGLAEGEEVVAKAAPFLRSGDAVRVLAPDAGRTASADTMGSSGGAQ